MIIFDIIKSAFSINVSGILSDKIKYIINLLSLKFKVQGMIQLLIPIKTYYRFYDLSIMLHSDNKTWNILKN